MEENQKIKNCNLKWKEFDYDYRDLISQKIYIIFKKFGLDDIKSRSSVQNISDMIYEECEWMKNVELDIEWAETGRLVFVRKYDDIENKYYIEILLTI